MKRSELVAVIKDAALESGQYSEDEAAENFASDLSDTLEAEFSLIDEEEDEEEEF